MNMYLGYLILILVKYGHGSNFSKLRVGFTFTKPIIFPHVPEIIGVGTALLLTPYTHLNKNETTGTHEKCSIDLQCFVILSSTNNVILRMKILVNMCSEDGK